VSENPENIDINHFAAIAIAINTSFSFREIPFIYFLQAQNRIYECLIFSYIDIQACTHIGEIILLLFLFVFFVFCMSSNNVVVMVM
jgi:hypothetical protein